MATRSRSCCSLVTSVHSETAVPFTVVCMMDDWREENALLVLGPGCGLAGLGCSP